MWWQAVRCPSSVQPSSAIDLAVLECLPAADGDVVAGCSMSVDVQLSSAINLDDLQCLPAVESDGVAGSSMSVKCPAVVCRRSGWPGVSTDSRR